MEFSGKSSSRTRKIGQGSSGQCNQDRTSTDVEAEQTNKIERISKSEAVGSSCCFYSPSHQKPNHVKTGSRALYDKTARNATCASRKSASEYPGQKAAPRHLSFVPLILCVHPSLSALFLSFTFPFTDFTRAELFYFSD